MNIRKKIFLGFMVIAVILFLAGITIMFEMRQIRSSASSALSENIKNISEARSMQSLLDRQNIALFNYVITENDSVVSNLYSDIENYGKSYKLTKNTNSINIERQIIDSMYITYSQYHKVIDTILNIKTPSERKVFFAKKFNEIHEHYTNISNLIKQLFLVNKNAVEKNSILINESYYRMIMPAIISIVTGILLIFLFYYFIVIYMIKPVEKITKALNAFTSTRVPYNVEFENKDDEISHINVEIKKLTELAKKYEKEVKQQ